LSDDCTCLLDGEGEIQVLDSDCSQHGYTVHIAGLQVTFGTMMRQRCAWCGEVIEERDAANMAVATDQTASEEVQQHEANEVIHGIKWEVGGLVAVAFSRVARWAIDEPADGKAPPESCMQKEAAK
jgi:hypothetical protein